MRLTVTRLLLPVIMPVLAACGALGAGSSLRSTTSIQPGTSFRLGGGQRGAFVVRGRNSGNVAISVFREVDGLRDSLLTLRPGAPVDARFPATATAIFVNTSPTASASFTVTVTGDISALGMSYDRPKR